MEKFPEISEGQTVLLRAECSTGIIMDEMFKWATNDSQKVYTLFNSFQEAREAAIKIIREKGDLVECAVYGKNEKCLEHLRPGEIS